MHFTLTGALWLNMVDRSFCDVTGKRIRRDSFDRVLELELATGPNFAKHNAVLQRFF